MRQKPILYYLVLAGLVFFVHTSEALTTNWINASGGNWSDPANWDNGVPTANDTANITLNSAYTVHIDTIAVATKVILGGASGSQTLQVDTMLTVGGSAYSVVVNTNGILDVRNSLYLGTDGNVNYIYNSGAFYVRDQGSIHCNNANVYNFATLHFFDGASADGTGQIVNSGGTITIEDVTSNVFLFNSSGNTKITGSLICKGIQNDDTLEVFSSGSIDLQPETPFVPSQFYNIGVCRLRAGCAISGVNILPSHSQVGNVGLLEVLADSADLFDDVSFSVRYVDSQDQGLLRLVDANLLALDSMIVFDSVTVAEGCTLSVYGSTFGSTARVGGSGTVEFAGGANTVQGTWWFVGGFVLSGMVPTTIVSCDLNSFQFPLSSLNLTTNFVNITLHGTTPLSVHTLTQYGGIISGRITVGSQYNWQWGRLRADENDEFTIDPGVSLNVNGNLLKFLDSLELIIEGSAVMQDSGKFHLLDSSVVNVTPTGSLLFGPAFTMDSIGSLYNSGETTFDPQSSPVRILVPVINSTIARTPGTIEILSGSVTFGDGGSNGGAIQLADSSQWIVDGDYVNTGTITIAENSVMQVLGLFINDTTGIINGNGTLDISQADTFINNGTISPGLSPGQLSVVGDLAFGARSILRMELGGANPAEYDRLNISGNLHLGGTLSLVRLNNFVPEPSDNLQMLTATGWSGAFDHITGTDLGNGQFLNLRFGPGGMEIGVLEGLNPVISVSQINATTARLTWRSVSGAQLYTIHSDSSSTGMFLSAQQVLAPDTTATVSVAGSEHQYYYVTVTMP